MNYGPNGLSLTKGFEGCQLSAYQDSGGIWTIGYGHTGLDVVEGLVWTPEEAAAQLVADIQWANSAVNSLVKSQVNQNQHDAMVDFCFNVGFGNFRGSTLLGMVNQGNFQGAAEQFGLWVHAGGEVVSGLIRRRLAEANLFREAVA